MPFQTSFSICFEDNIDCGVIRWLVLQSEYHISCQDVTFWNEWLEYLRLLANTSYIRLNFQLFYKLLFLVVDRMKNKRLENVLYLITYLPGQKIKAWTLDWWVQIDKEAIQCTWSGSLGVCSEMYPQGEVLMQFFSFQWQSHAHLRLFTVPYYSVIIIVDDKFD